MSRSKNAKARILSESAEALAELLADTSDSIQFSFNGVEWDRLGRLIASLAGLGALVTVYLSGDSQRFCCSVRVGSSKRSYDFETAGELNAWVPGMEKQLSGLHKRVSENGTDATVSHSKTRKGGDADRNTSG